MAIIVRAGAGEACCIMGLIHIEDLWQEKGGRMVNTLSAGRPGDQPAQHLFRLTQYCQGWRPFRDK